MNTCKYCPEQTSNYELLPDKEHLLIETPICESCFKKLELVEEI